MLLPIEWLKDYVELDMSIRELSDELTYSGSHIESIIDLDLGIKNVVVGKILEIIPHENADKLVVCKVDVGNEKLQIVTGADNISEGDLVPVALIGAKLADGLKIKKGKLRGVESFGMLCSLEELGYSENVIPLEAKDGIYIINEEVEVGQPISDLLDLESYVFEIEITPNRSDCLSIIGLARETAATFNKTLELPEIKIKNEEDNIENYISEVKIESNKCNRYYTKIIKDVEVKPSPMWLQDRLMKAGVRPINNIVDVSNYVMLEFGQPLHTFDLDKINGKEIYIRQAKFDESIKTLDGEIRKLKETDLIIADSKKPIAIAGVMGGLDTEITEETKTVLVESANFDERSVRLTSKSFNLRTEASSRYEKGIDPNLSKKVGDRFCQIIEEIGAGKVVKGEIDLYENPVKPWKVSLTMEKVNKVLGTNISKEEGISYLTGLGLEIIDNGSDLEVLIPTFRPDIQIEEDLVEEIGRLYGFHNIEPKPLVSRISRGTRPYDREIIDKSKNILSSIGYDEILTYSFISPKAYDKINLDEKDEKRNSIKLLNPLGEDYSVMRRTILPNLLEVITRNYNRNVEEGYFYEVGNIFIPEDEELTKLPEHKYSMVIGGFGGEDFFHLKGALEILFNRIGLPKREYIRNTSNPTYHPGRTANIKVEDKTIGIIGEVHLDVLDNYQIKDRVYVAEIDFEKVINLSSLEREFKELPKYPAMTRDIAIILDEKVLSSEVEKVISRHGSDLIEEIKLFDVYDGDQIPDGKKSMAYSIVYRSYEGTLEEARINKVQEDLIKDLEETFNAELRS